MTRATERRLRIEPSAKRVRAFLGGTAVVDSSRPVLVWENPAYPAFYFPIDDVRLDLLTGTDGVRHSPSLGDGRLFTVTVGDRAVVDAAWRYQDSPFEELRELVRFDWGSMDAWFEEDEEVYTHPRSPYTRIDILASSRAVRIELDGVVLAESHSPRLLFETGLPVRYYLPKTDVRLDLLEPSPKVTHCPYKGSAEHLSARIGTELHPEIAWSYRTPLPESQKITGLVAFYDEKVDVYVDGELQERPRTAWSSGRNRGSASRSGS